MLTQSRSGKSDGILVEIYARLENLYNLYMRKWPYKIPRAQNKREKRRTTNKGDLQELWYKLILTMLYRRSCRADARICLITVWLHAILLGGREGPSQAHAGQLGLILLPNSQSTGSIETTIQSQGGMLQLAFPDTAWM